MNHERNLLLPALAAAALLAACGDKAPAPEEKVAEAEAAVAEAEAALELAKREADLAQREAELSLKEKEAELARREAELAARDKAAPRAAPRPAPTRSAAPAPAPEPKVVEPPKPLVLAAGTPIQAELVREVSTKTAIVGDLVEARLTSDLVIDGRVAAPAGSLVQGSVSRVVSGSKVIGGTPTLGLTFHKLTVASGDVVDIAGGVTQQGKSDRPRDAAKIAGGAVIGAVVGKQVDDDKGKVVGGLLGAAAGAAAAQRTGTEVVLPAGTIVVFDVERQVQLTR